MGLKALVDYSLIKELCEGEIKCSKHNFTGKVKPKHTQYETKTEDKVNKIKRLLLPSDREKEKTRKSQKIAKIIKKKSDKSEEEYFSNSSNESNPASPESFVSARQSGSDDFGTSESGSSSEVSELD